MEERESRGRAMTQITLELFLLHASRLNGISTKWGPQQQEQQARAPSRSSPA